MSAALGCSTSAESGSHGDQGVPQDAATAQPELEKDAAPKCDRAAPVPLWVDTEDGHPTRVHVPATVGATEGVMLLDTGSTASFLSTPAGSPDPTSNGGTLTIGSCSQQLMGRPYAAEGSHLRPGLGFFGVDQIVEAPRTALDLAGGSLTRIFDGGGPKTTEWPRTTLELVAGSLLVRVKLGGKSVRLLVDTGSPHILWLGQGKEPGDREEKTVDAVGNEILLFTGVVDAELTTGRVEQLPVTRAPSFPYLEARRPEFGGELDGLLGLSALGLRKVVFDRANGVMYRGPGEGLASP